MKRFLIFLTLLSCMTGLNAQPAKRRLATTTKAKQATKKPAAEKKVDRATLMFPTSAEMPEDVVWRRDIYRQLDLLKDANAPLYYPVEPHGKEQNLFTYLFRLFVSGRINVYRYKLDGNESFDEKDKANVKELLEQYRIYYEEEGGRITVPESDIPSAMVTRFYIKESSYFDQRSATYRTRVTALCPVLMEGDEFESVDNDGSSATPKPLFWVKYDDVATYLTRLPMMSSNLNNVTNMTADDYFTLNYYDGQIYKTNNMQGRVMPADSTRTREQQHIEQQLRDFEEHIWHASAPKDSIDSLAVQQPAQDTKASRKSKRESSRESRRSKSSAAASKGGGSSAPRVSARRQRR